MGAGGTLTSDDRDRRRWLWPPAATIFERGKLFPGLVENKLRVPFRRAIRRGGNFGLIPGQVPFQVGNLGRGVRAGLWGGFPPTWRGGVQQTIYNRV